MFLQCRGFLPLDESLVRQPCLFQGDTHVLHQNVIERRISPVTPTQELFDLMKTGSFHRRFWTLAIETRPINDFDNGIKAFNLYINVVDSQGLAPCAGMVCLLDVSQGFQELFLGNQPETITGLGPLRGCGSAPLRLVALGLNEMSVCGVWFIVGWSHLREN
jgi:hypothetical protein